MTALNLDEAKLLLDRAPGPSPWYLRRKAPFMESRTGPLTWQTCGVELGLANARGEILVMLGIYSYAQPLGPGSLLVWREREDEVVFHAIDLDQCTPIAAPEQTATIMRQHRIPWVALGAGAERLLTLHVRCGDEALVAALEPPDELSALESLSFFVHHQGTRLCHLDCRNGVFEVLPQDWFNKGEFDFGYQWPTRVALDPASGRFVGDGIRVGTFVLDESKRNVERWLTQS